MANLAIRNRLTVGNVWQGGAVALFNPNYPGVLVDLGNVTDSAFDQELEATDFRTAHATGTLITEARPIKRLELPITIKVNSRTRPRSTSPCLARAKPPSPRLRPPARPKTSPSPRSICGTKSPGSKSPTSS